MAADARPIAKTGEKILIGEKISITVVRITPGIVRIGVEAPEGLAILRENLSTGGKLPAAPPNDASPIAKRPSVGSDVRGSMRGGGGSDNDTASRSHRLQSFGHPAMVRRQAFLAPRHMARDVPLSLSRSVHPRYGSRLRPHDPRARPRVKLIRRPGLPPSPPRARGAR